MLVVDAPHLMPADAASVLREMVWLNEIARARGRAPGRLLDSPIEVVVPDELTAEAWRVADELGWAKVHDARYVARARLVDRKLVTLDERLLDMFVRVLRSRSPGTSTSPNGWLTGVLVDARVASFDPRAGTLDL